MSELNFGRILRHAERYRDELAVHDLGNGHRATDGEHFERVGRVCEALAALGVRGNSPFAVLSGAGHHYIELWRAGLVGSGLINPLNTRLAADEIVYILNDSDAEVLFVDAANAATALEIRARVPRLRQLIQIGAKGGSDFDPKGKSDREIMRFCQSFMAELHRHIGANTDVPAGDIGVGSREISYMFGHYKRLENEFTGVLTGKMLEFGGSEIRAEATGYGTVYFMEDMLRHQGQSIEGKTCLVSGSGNVALYAVEKLIQHGAKPVTVSDSSGFVHDPDGIDKVKLAWLKKMKEVRHGRIKEYADEFGVEFFAGQRPWSVPCDLAFPCATQNEISREDAQTLVSNGCIGVSEGANMPSDAGAIDTYLDARIFYGPAKAANAGGVAVSGLEMAQNSLRMSWSREELNDHLGDIMRAIHDRCLAHGTEPDGYVNYLRGANIAGFIKVADALLAYGVV